PAAPRATNATAETVLHTRSTYAYVFVFVKSCLASGSLIEFCYPPKLILNPLPPLPDCDRKNGLSEPARISGASKTTEQITKFQISNAKCQIILTYRRLPTV